MKSKFKEIAPGVMVGKKITFSFPHPDPCWIIKSKEHEGVLTGSGALLIFSDEEKAKGLMEKEPEDSYLIEKFSWDVLVDTFGGTFSSVTVDKKNEAGFYQSVPLQKGI